MRRKFPFYKQLDAMDCGATCLRMIAKYHGKFYSLEYLREISTPTKEGISIGGIAEAAEQIGFKTLGTKVDYQKLNELIPTPCIAYWNQNHFVVIYEVTDKQVVIGDPAIGIRKIKKSEFENGWVNDIIYGEGNGVLLLLETTPEFFKQPGEEKNKSKTTYLLSYFKAYKSLIFQLLIGLLFGSIIQLSLPFFMKALVDIGIGNFDVGFVGVILIAQFTFLLAYAFMEFLRGWILLHIGSRVSISLVSEFLLKLTRLPIRYFDTKMTGDFLQRIYDNERIQEFFGTASVITVFSFTQIIVFGVALAWFSAKIFLIFFISTIAYFAWVLIFLKKRRQLNYQKFDNTAESQNTLIQMINGMQDIKMYNAEQQKRWAWERIQARLFYINTNYLSSSQWERAGTKFINETKNLLIIFVTAKAVIDGDMTLGALVAIQYIIGAMATPLEEMVLFIHGFQDVKVSLERMGEIHKRKEENATLNQLNVMPDDYAFTMEDVSFKYGGKSSKLVLNKVNLYIPKGKVTAIVGASGSGKTTLLKLLLKFYEPLDGTIKIGDYNLSKINNRLYRDKVGVVLQDGYIFSDTIGANIALGDEIIDKEKLIYAVKIAHVQEFIESMPLGYNTKIGLEGIGLSKGQLQRILIARAVYKQPDIFIFDEATNSLDLTTERFVMTKLLNYFFDKTVVIVAHRLSTVKNADNIIVLNNGSVVEQGSHFELINKRGHYYDLTNNQLENA